VTVKCGIAKLVQHFVACSNTYYDCIEILPEIFLLREITQTAHE